MINAKQEQYDYESVRYTFSAIRRHLFKDRLYHVHVLANCITIGEVKIKYYAKNFHDPKPKYMIELDIKNRIYWKTSHQQERQFGILYKNNVKYFEANTDHLTKFKQAIICEISFHQLEDFYKFDEQLGKGSFSSVYKVIRNRDGKAFAMKYTQSKQKNDKENMQLIMNEIKILQKLNSEQIIKIYEVYKMDEFHYGFILEYIDGSCLAHTIDQMKKQKCSWKEQEIKVCMHQLLQCVNYLHSQNVIHRDIKPQNIMLNGSDFKQIKLIDFGLSIKNQKQHNKCGTPGYMPPEILNIKKEAPRPWDYKCDMFSLGVVFYKLQGVQLLQKDCHEGQVASKGQILTRCSRTTRSARSTSNQYPMFISTHQQGISNQLEDLVKKLLEKDPDERMSAIDALRHPYFSDLQSNIDLQFGSIMHNSSTKFFHSKPAEQLQQQYQILDKCISEEKCLFEEFGNISNERNYIEQDDKFKQKAQFKPSRFSRGQKKQFQQQQ